MTLKALDLVAFSIFEKKPKELMEGESW